MAWFKKVRPNAVKDVGLIDVQTIPDIFYGGNDPEIYVKAGNNNAVNGNANKNYNESHDISNGSSMAKSKKKIILIIALALFFAGFVGATSWYYFRDYMKNDIIISEAPIINTTSTVFEEASVIEELPATTTEKAVETNISANIVEPIPTSTISADVISDFPADNLIDTSDFDADALTDAEEEIYGTDMSIWDTDADGYYDGQEVYNLYNPKGFAPVKLIDSGLAREYVSSIWGYRVYYPAKWQAGGVDTEGKQVLFSDISGDYVEIRIVNKNPSEDFVTWFANHIKGQKINSLLQMQNRFETPVWKRNDDLVAYIPNTNWTAVVIYHPLSDSPIKHRHIMQMMIQSFRTGSSLAELPSQSILPAVANNNVSDNATMNNYPATNPLEISGTNPKATSTLP